MVKACIFTPQEINEAQLLMQAPQTAQKSSPQQNEGWAQPLLEACPSFIPARSQLIEKNLSTTPLAVAYQWRSQQGFEPIENPPALKKSDYDEASQTRAEVLDAWFQGTFTEYAMAIEAYPQKPSQKLLEKVQAQKARWKVYLEENRIDEITERNRYQVFTRVAKHFNRAHWTTENKTKFLLELNDSDLLLLYKLSLVADFFEEERIEYSPGTSVTDIVEKGTGDCNTLDTHAVTYETPKQVGRYLGYMAPPDHATQLVHLHSNGKHVFFENAHQFTPPDKYTRDAKGNPLKLATYAPWMIITSIFLETAEKLEKNHPEMAISLLKKVTQLDPKDDVAHNHLGSYFATQGDYDAAVFHHRKAYQINPQEKDYRANLISNLLKRAHEKNSISNYLEVLQLDSLNIYAHRGLAILLEKKNRFDEALVHYNKVVQLDSNDAVTHQAIGWILCYKKDQLGDGVFHYRRALEINPKDSQTHYFLGDALLKLDQVKKAIQHLEEAHRIKPNDKDIKTLLKSAREKARENK